MIHTFSQIIGKVTTWVKKFPVESAIIIVLAIITSYIVIPVRTAIAAQNTASNRVIALTVQSMQNATSAFGELPEAKLIRPSYSMIVPATAYNSTPEQCDDTPFITAWQTPVRDGIIAANFLPFGTKVKIPALYGDKVFVVEDRMNARYDKRIDIWMESHSDAIKFGLKNVTIEIYK